MAGTTVLFGVLFLFIFVLLMSVLAPMFGIPTLLDVRLCQPLPLEDTTPVIFGIGLPRTGTCSLTEALNTLGCASQHFPYKFIDNVDLYLSRKKGFVDLSMLGLRPVYLKKRFPASKMVYTFRNTGKWAKAVLELYERLTRFQVFPMSVETRDKAMGLLGATVEKLANFKKTYEGEVDEIEERFPNDLLRLNICDEKVGYHTWLALSTFIGSKVTPKTPFPHRKEVPYHFEQFWRNLL